MLWLSRTIIVLMCLVSLVLQSLKTRPRIWVSWINDSHSIGYRETLVSLEEIHAVYFYLENLQVDSQSNKYWQTLQNQFWTKQETRHLSLVLLWNHKLLVFVMLVTH